MEEKREAEKAVRVVNYVDDMEKSSNYTLMQSALGDIVLAAEVMHRNGIRVTDETLRAVCLMERQTNYEDVPEVNFNPNKSEHQPKRQVAVTKWLKCDALLMEFNRLETRTDTENMTPSELEEFKAETARRRDELLEEIFSKLDARNIAGRNKLAAVVAAGEGGEVTTSRELMEHATELATNYITTNEGLEAKKLLQEVCDKANQLRRMFALYAFDIRKVLKIDASGFTSPGEVDFDMYFKN